MGRIRILPYKVGSAGAKRIAVALNGKLLKLENSKFRPRADDVIINWGSSDGFHSALVQPAAVRALVFNHPLYLTTNKLDFYKVYPKLVPEFTTDKRCSCE